MEVWGAEGGTVSGCTPEIYKGGKGGYSVGNKFIDMGNIIYLVVGSKGADSNANHVDVSGGYNGGGNVIKNVTVNHFCAGGGGASHIATKDRGILSNYANYKLEILIVAGGGGGGRDQMNHEPQAAWGVGGDGGGLVGGGPFPGRQDGPGLQMNQTANGLLGTDGTFGSGAIGHGQSGGGGGWYGGASSGSTTVTEDGAEGASGGSGYIGGVTNGTTTAGVQSGNGKALITWMPLL